MDVALNKNTKLIGIWVLLFLAFVGTFVLTKRLGKEGNAASVFLGRGDVRTFYLSENKVEPTFITAEVGDEIVFMVLDESIHNIAEERSHRHDARLESGEFGAGESYSLSFGREGTYSFYDRMDHDITVMITIK